VSAVAPELAAAQAVKVPVLAATRAAGLTSRMWPPHFDTQGAAYIFQPKSGCFLDPISNYYYCPKSKSYYNATTGDYYRFVGGTDPDTMYVKMSIPEPTGTPIDDDGSASGKDSEKSRKPVVISMANVAKNKIKVIPVSNLSADASAVPSELLTTTSSAAIRVSENISKWQQRQKEDPPEGTESVSQSRARSGSIEINNNPLAPVENTPSTSAASVAVASSIAVCLLCRRQFPSAELLRRHEKESKLHAENVAKSAAEQAAAQDSASTKYRDRASERRALYPGEEEEVLESREKSSKDASTPKQSRLVIEQPAVIVPPEPVASDLCNPGNVLLRKMGWSDGEGLGKESSGQVVPVALDAKTTSAALAPGDKTGVGVADRLPQIIYGDSKEFKESVNRATRARYESLEKNKNSSGL
jgi:RNA-binding protein 5/10